MIYHYHLKTEESYLLRERIITILNHNFKENMFHPFLFDKFENRETLVSSLTDSLSSNMLNFIEISNNAAALYISGFAINNKNLKDTPESWENKSVDLETRIFESYQLVIGNLIGKIYQMETCQNNHLIHDLFPIEKDKDEQYGTGSTFLHMHTEDAFSDFRPDYLLLGALRNNDKIATLISVPDLENINEIDKQNLSLKEYYILPDGSHLLDTYKGEYAKLVRNIIDNPKPIAILEKINDEKYNIRYEEVFLRPIISQELNFSYSKLKEEIHNKITPIVLHQGDLLILNNNLTIHGRDKICPHYDGSDRWLKRLFIRRKYNV